MTEDELKDLTRQARKARRIASERAGELHDLVEDRLPAAYHELPTLAQATYDACAAWVELDQQLTRAQSGA